MNAGECVRRLFFVIFAPDSQQESSPLSGRKSTQATVRICGASSIGRLAILQTADVPAGEIEGRLDIIQALARKGNCCRVFGLIDRKQREVIGKKQFARLRGTEDEAGIVINADPRSSRFKKISL
ncbi:hypothetical protein ACVI1J_010540 [Bradyrhizobium diazoefficiens]